MNGKDGFGQNSGSEAAAGQLWKASLEEFAGNRRFYGSEAAVRGQGSALLTNRNRHIATITISTTLQLRYNRTDDVWAQNKNRLQTP